MKITAYLHPRSSFLPCTGVGRHINNIILGLQKRPGVNLELLVSSQWTKGSGQLDARSPLKDLPTRSFPFSERIAEYSWKVFGCPYMDRWASQPDWVYCPAQSLLPVRNALTAITIHDIEAFEKDLPWSNTRRHKKFRMRWALWVNKAIKKANIVFTVSQFTKKRMVELLDVDPKKIKVVGNGVEKRFLKNGKYTKAPQDFPYALVIGGLRQRKGAEAVIEVARKLKKQSSPIRIVTIGQNEDKYLKQAQLLDNLIVLGMKSDEVVSNYLNHASSLLFLSYYEGFGIPALEAMAAQVPVVGSDKASLPEIIGDAGFTINPRQTDKITAVVQELEQNRAFRTQVIQKGIRQVRRYDWDKCVDAVLDAFKSYHH